MTKVQFFLRLTVLVFVVGFTNSGLAEPVRIRLWHQLIYSHRTIQSEALREFEQQNPDIVVESLYRETEELRSAFQAAALGGSGPELVYGPSDQVGPMAAMGLLGPLDGIYSQSELKDFDPASLIEKEQHLYMIGDTVGNHLSLLYNRKLISTPPTSTEELFRMGREFKSKTGKYFFVWPMQEPFFFIPWVAGFGEPFIGPHAEPHLDSAAMRKAFDFILELKKTDFVPHEADYETANALFKQGQVAMLINGDWSWGDYRKAGIDFGIARIPMVSETKKWPAPLISTRGYSLNVNLAPEKRAAALRVLKFLLSAETQLKFTKQASLLPSRLSLRQSPLVKNNLELQASASVMEVGQPMPVEPELRAIWDVLRKHYQAVLAGSETSGEAAKKSQVEALEQIQVMNSVELPTYQAWIVQGIFFVLFLFIIWKSFAVFKNIWFEIQNSRGLPYFLLMPAMLGVLLVVVFPFLFNFLISFSNLSLRTFQNWQVIGFQNYTRVLSDPQFYVIFVKTVIWTFLNLLFHVSLGVFLGVVINQTLPAKQLFRLLLIIPWAVPQYITALTWRGLFNEEYGAINVVIKEYLHGPAIQWLSRPIETFMACLLTNIWLGFPFMMMVTLGGLQAIPKDLYEAARVDGANAFQRFRNITWPLLQPVLRPATILGAIWTFNNLNVLWLVSNGGEPADQTHILVSYVYKSAFQLYRYNSSAALSMLIFIILLAWTVFYLRSTKESK